jgi:zinc transport system ATP-binding protein
MVSAAPIVAFQHVTFAYDAEPVLEDIDFTVMPGDYVAVVGPNGGGKTTLIKLILGVLSPQEGTIHVCGESPRKRQTSIGYVPQHAAFQPHFPITVLETVLMGLPREGRRTPGYRVEDKDRAMTALKQVGMEHEARKRFDALSGGQKQRTLVARALVAAPKLVLCDEPTANVDPHGKVCLFDLFASLVPRHTVIVVSHDLVATASSVTSVAVVNRRIIQRRRLDAAMLTLMYGEHGASCPISEYLQGLHQSHPPRP